MRRQPILRDFDAVGEAGGDHPPADATLQRAEPENEPQRRPQRRFHPAAPQEPEKRQQKRHADQPAEQAMRPFPPIDGLELRETHAGIELAVLRDGLIFLELGLPPTFAERRQRAQHRLPLGDREAGFGEPGGAADQDHRQNQRGDGIEPQPDGAGVKFACCRHHRSLFRGARGPYRAPLRLQPRHCEECNDEAI